MNFEDLTPEQMERARACKTVDELVELIKTEGVELTDEQMDAVAGGDSLWDDVVGCEGQACVNYGCVDYDDFFPHTR